ncbi:MAG: lipid-binding SYLF domain-containing protein [Gemmatimonadota bacterium]|nr:lipid-binding SYLF domain-containing protein [Gemmatimonadota bacterium]
MRHLPTAIALSVAASFAAAEALGAQDVRDDVTETIDAFVEADEGMEEWFETAHAYAVLPNVGKGGFIVGAAHGTGQVFEGGDLIGELEMALVSVGLQIGGQSYSEVIFFQNEGALQRLIDGNLEFSSAVSAVIVTSGVAASANYSNGLAVFTRPKGGAMAEASLAGQKFEFTPYP